MKNALEEEMNSSARLKIKIDILEERIAWSPGGVKQKQEREWLQQEEHKVRNKQCRG